MKKINLSELKSAKHQSIDLFIVSASFEDRCKSVAIHLVDVAHSIVVENKNLSEYVGQNAAELRYMLRDSHPIDTPASTEGPVETADSFLQSLSLLPDKAKNLRMLIDISTFTHEQLLILFRILDSEYEPDNVTFCYTGADYCPQTGDFRGRWLSKGVNDVRSVLGYVGGIVPSMKTNLIVMVGYEHERASSLIDGYQPERITLGYGEKGTETSENDGGANEYFKNLVLRMIASYGNVSEFRFPCDDPVKTKLMLDSIVKSNEGFNNIIAPMNTKLSTIGAALSAIDDDNVQLCYASVQQYNYLNYSFPKDYCYLVSYGELRKLSQP